MYYAATRPFRMRKKKERGGEKRKGTKEKKVKRRGKMNRENVRKKR